MKLLFKQKMFSWFDSYDIFDEEGNTVYTVKGQLAWGHCLKIFDAEGYDANREPKRSVRRSRTAAMRSRAAVS